MRASGWSVIGVVALLVLAGCAGSPSAPEGDSSPDVAPSKFPDSSAINQSVFDRHATALANTSFTMEVKQSQKQITPHRDGNFTYHNSTTQYLVEPAASQYLLHVTGWTISGLGGPESDAIYSNGRTAHVLVRENNESTVRPFEYPIFNESSELYLWHGWFDEDRGDRYPFTAINATYERKGVETFQGVPVMRYEATGVDALSDSIGDGNASSVFENFSATLLIDANGVIRHYHYEFVYVDYHTPRVAQSYTISDVGSTDVEKPDWVSNETAGS